VLRDTIYLKEGKPCPLNKFLLDDDCVYVLKRCYFNYSKDELIQDEEVMVNFFGSAEKGKEILINVSNAEWDSME
jgi:hypothetical protein